MQWGDTMGTEIVLGFLKQPDMYIGSRAGMGAITHVARAAMTRLSGDIFRLTDWRMRHVFAGAFGRNVEGSMLMTAHPRSLSQLEPMMANGPAKLGAYGGLAPDEHPAVFIHSKSLVANRELATVNTVAIMGASRDPIFDVTALFQGRGARALDDLITAAVDNDLPRMRKTAVAAAKLGILANDPLIDVAFLSQGMRQAIDIENQSLLVISKTLRDPDALARILAARQRGAHVSVRTWSLPPDVEQQLRDAGVELLTTDRWIHGNLIVARGARQAVWGSAHLTPRAYGAGVADGLNGNGEALEGAELLQRSRELGAITRDRQALRQIRDGVRNIPWRERTAADAKRFTSGRPEAAAAA